MHAKGEVGDALIAQEIGDRPFRQVMGFNADEVSLRVEADGGVLQAQHPSGDVRMGAHPVQVRIPGPHRHRETAELE
ncbi:hypothetical protein [Streptomyces sp. CdTB01]|uniref:hypothetical protein n=1 Tax=Streptomyces sp. CdTB01 TaxID=1725411 RepID=UPI00073ABA9F|nr:hypothetical protein [Streptomyces sp. CdTB01]ALV39245.1 hypothetical protein AS200_44950 [Streptomyces sp. CdTB01]